VALLFVILATLFFRFFFKIQDATDKKMKLSLSGKIIKALQGEKPPPFSSKMLEVLEEFNQKLSGKDWDHLKFFLAKRDLLPKARKWATSPFWIKRNKAARIFALAPLIEDEVFILKLVHDSKFLVRSIAAFSAIQIESKEAVIEILKQMSTESGYSYFFYMDLLSQSSQKVLELIAKAKQYRLPSLAVLATKTIHIPLSNLEEDLRSKDPLIRKAAIKVLIRNPEQGVEALLLEALKEPDAEIRAAAASALQNYPSNLVQVSLESALKDQVWQVKIEAGKALKHLGLLKKSCDIYEYITEFE
jgi:HEAT repeat protein